MRDFLTERMRGSGRNGLLQRWLETSPNILEPMQIYPAALIAHEVGTPVYVVHTSAWQSVDLIRDLKDKGWPVFGETLAAFLYWTAPEADARDKGAVGKIQPPIRLDRDRDALWTGVLDGTLTSVGTDCQMYPHSSRTEVDFWDAQVGLGPGMGTALAAVHTSGVLTGRRHHGGPGQGAEREHRPPVRPLPAEGRSSPSARTPTSSSSTRRRPDRRRRGPAQRGRLLALRGRVADRLAGADLRARAPGLRQRRRSWPSRGTVGTCRRPDGGDGAGRRGPNRCGTPGVGADVRRWTVHGLVLSLAAISAASLVAVALSAAAPLIQQTFGLSEVGVGAIASGIYLGSAASAVAGGRLTDSLRARRRCWSAACCCSRSARRWPRSRRTSSCSRPGWWSRASATGW